MKDEAKHRKKKVYRKPEAKSCYYCGSNDIEQIHVAHVGIIKTCRNCKEQID